MFPNLDNIDPNVLKQQSDMMKNLSDEELKRRLDQSKAFMPGMAAGMPDVSPQMMRQMMDTMNNMPPEQLQNMTKMFAQQQQQQQRPPQQNQPNQYQSQQQPQQSRPSQQNTAQPNIKSSASANDNKNQSNQNPSDIDHANKFKEEANQLYKEQKPDKACEKYYEAINSIRLSQKYKNSPEGRQVEIACRLNIALCKNQVGDYSTAIDQCERVLNYEPENWKANYRMSHSLFQQTKGESNIKSIYNYAQKAVKGNPNDAKIKEFFQEVKEKYDKFTGNNTSSEQSQSNDQKQEEEKQEPSIEESSSNYAYVPTQAGVPNLATMPQQEKMNLIKQNSERIKNLDDNQLNNMIGMMKNNKEMLRSQYKAMGMDMSDEQLDALTNMMSPELIKSASQMASQNPEMLQANLGNRSQNVNEERKQQQQVNQSQPKESQATEKEEIKEQYKPQAQAQPQMESQQIQQNQQFPTMMNQGMGMGQNGNMADMMQNMMNNPMMQQMMSNPEMMKQAASMMGGNGSIDPNGMQSMMQNPSLKGLLSNPDFLSNTLGMLKNPAMQNMMQQQSPGLNLGLLVKGLEVLVKVSNAFRSVKRAWSNIFVRLTIFALLVAVIAYYFN